MDYCYSYFYNSNTNFEPKKLACEAGFVDEGGSAVPLPEELTKMFKPLECELCGVTVTSEVTAYTHYEGKVHMKNVNAFMKEQYNIYGSVKKIKVEFTPHQCEVCKCDLSSLIQAQQHYSGKVHKKNLRKINYDPQAAMALPPDTCVDDIGPDLLKDLPPPPPPPVLSDFICEICNITTNTEYQLIVHKNGSKHKKKVKKLKESFGDFGTDGFGYFTGDMPVEPSVEGQVCASMEPIVTDYLPLSNEPLQFNNSSTNNVHNIQNVNLPQTMTNHFNEEEYEPVAPLCIKWFNDRKEALPTRPLEDAWVETFKKSSEGVSVSNVRIHEASPEVANLPQFSVAAVLPQLQAPPSPPIGLITSSLFDDKTSSEHIETPASLDPPRIHFRDAKEPPDSGGSESKISLPEVNENKNDQDITDVNVDPALSSNVNTVVENPKPISFEVASTQNNLCNKSTNNEKIDKSFNSSKVKKNNEFNKGKFITSNWECSEEKSVDNEDNLKKQKSSSVLFGFKKGLNKKLTEDNIKNSDNNNLQETSISKLSEPGDIKNTIVPNEETINGPSKEKDNLNKEQEKNCNLKEDEERKKHSKKSEESKCSKEKNNSKYRKEKYEKDSYDYHKDSRDYKKDSHDYRKDSHDYHKNSRDYRKDSYDYYKESDGYYKDSRDHHRSRDSYKRHREHRKHKDDYDSSTDSDDDDYRHEKKKHRHSSKREKDSHKTKKPSLAQPFLHKSSDKHSIIDYLAPASECDSYDIAMYRTPSGSYYCTRCDYKSKSSSDFSNHLYSRDHKDRKKNKK